MQKNKSHFLKKVAFIKHIEKIKNESLRKYCLSFFKIENLVFKLILFICIGIVVLGSGFGIEFWYVKNNPDAIVLNPGVGFSFGQNFDSWAVYLIQSIPIVISLIAFVFVPRWWMSFGFLMMLFGGLSNIIDRSLDFVVNGESTLNKVVDYVSFLKTTINANDVWICIGVGFVVLSIIVWVFIAIKNDDHEGRGHHSHSKQTLTSTENEILLNSKNNH